MTKSEFKARSKNLFDTYNEWFEPERESWGLYEISYMPGWLPILEELFSNIAEQLTPDASQRFRINQIKEKFGTLRFYYSGQGLRVDVQSK
ncbi:hypothetical protein [Candidatus Endoriftia persephonae]|jgi:hypothetical protein|uniref:Uncharacterized protein n=2 Tax=Gammaproteobacteria TaxID=1236 RepID=G2FEB4_9GAMM|nr:hypothetical protein [Candidatus Endoriftia persephone]EGW54884.1 hypothetical protein TevJSym_ah00630 [endosymbiont of Tevnia jerichonana (vent Tica)]USF89144.1 hypothetical protein L0Y14_07920 [Candidatus Endoriftia persephone]